MFVDVEVVLEGLAAQNAAYTSSLDEPRDSDGSGGSADRGRLAGVLGQVEPEFDLIEYRETLGPLRRSYCRTCPGRPGATAGRWSDADAVQDEDGLARASAVPGKSQCRRSRTG